MRRTDTEETEPIRDRDRDDDRIVTRTDTEETEPVREEEIRLRGLNERMRRLGEMEGVSLELERMNERSHRRRLGSYIQDRNRTSRNRKVIKRGSKKGKKERRTKRVNKRKGGKGLRR